MGKTMENGRRNMPNIRARDEIAARRALKDEASASEHEVDSPSGSVEEYKGDDSQSYESGSGSNVEEWSGEAKSKDKEQENDDNQTPPLGNHTIRWGML
ncbi:hypothetical protein HAX54_023271, partial [Datura stramonium]|nr:hypothetical protein [Datura stramonium]